MADISSITGTTTSPSAFSSLGGTTMGKEDFLKLLVAQLQNQDPLNPQDATEFTAQMAQFSSLEQLIGINEGIGGLSAASGEVEKLSALTLIGREIVATSAGFKVGEEGSLSGRIGYHLNDAAEEVTVSVLNASGQAVATLPPHAASAGEKFLDWDGRDAEGQPLPAGQYYLVVQAVDGNEAALPATPLVSGTITGVDFDARGSRLYSAIGEFRMSDVASVREI
ncbi:flagellar hook assembly protein FlgD [Desulfuromonas sp. AOP6]|uniref:flagellar hook assembly protein FlgD n=1 Tax=Desulfuromonas sp. AOP6 TaxID=1566351 RepID=UPI00127A0EE9|nr:flagellar hook assembly protein FlgD [Desulfuromonas sp. AOP6]BCA79113.1 basal-body rod modification protein FlgD [Desulfuromonas sp. AOP6]